MNELVKEKLKFNESAIYQISVAGNFNRSWSSRLADMQVTQEETLESKNVYNLIGKLKDQSELFGVLNTLNDLHLTLISVKVL